MNERAIIVFLIIALTLVSAVAVNAISMALRCSA